MTFAFINRTRVATGATVVAAAAGLIAFAPISGAGAATSCSGVDVVFARGTSESAGVGSVGSPFISSLTSDLAGVSVSSYAVNYAADVLQTSAGAGSADLVKHVTAVAASCPSTRFVLGGYSQGATVVDKALGIATTTGGAGTALPSALAPKVAAIVVFGNPLGLQGETIEKNSPTYGGRAESFCNSGDPVCGGGSNVAAHLAYSVNGTTGAGAAFAAAKVKSS